MFLFHVFLMASDKRRRKDNRGRGIRMRSRRVDRWDVKGKTRSVELMHDLRSRLAHRAATGRSRRGRLPPGPSTPPLVQLAAFLYEPKAFLYGVRQAHGEIVTLRLPSMFTVVQTSRPEHVQQVFRTSGDAAHAGKANAILKPFLGPHSLLMLDGARHLRHRRLLLPPFRGERMRAYGSTMQSLTQRAMASWPIGRTFRLQDETQRITLDVIVQTVFGLGDEAASLRAMLQRTLSLLDDPLYIVEFAQKDLGPWSPWGRYLRLRSEIQSALLTHIRASRHAADLDKRNDILSLLLLASDKDGAPLSDEEIHDELITMLIAGHETTATALSWTLHRLTRHADVLERVQAEIDHAFPSGDIDPDRIGELTYLDAVIKETMRIHPVIPGVGRVLQEPMQIDQYDLPPGVMVGCSILLAHTNNDIWPNPERFDPERFIGTRPSPYTYFPFGGGIRRCIGEAFALFEMRIVLANVLATLRPVAAPGISIRTSRRNITLSPSERMPIVFERR